MDICGELDIRLQHLINSGVRYIYGVNRQEHITTHRHQLLWITTQNHKSLSKGFKTFGSLRYGNLLVLLELIAKFEPFLENNISRYRDSGKGNVSYISKTICEALIGLMAKNGFAAIPTEVASSRYFSISVDYTPDMFHVY